jgi:hypothetical protein
VIPTFGQLSQEDDEFKASLSYLAKKEKKSGGKKKKNYRKRKPLWTFHSETPFCN